jgi:transposase-like protein
VIEQQERSGLSVAAFCRKQKVSPPSFYAWRRKWTQRQTPKSTRRQATPRFVPVRLPAAPAEFEVRLPNGITVGVPGNFVEAPLATLLELVAKLEQVPWERPGA